jgi:hypothetical protein
MVFGGVGAKKLNGVLKKSQFNTRALNGAISLNGVHMKI